MHTGIIFNHDFTYGHSRWAWILEAPAWLGMVLFFALSGYLMGKGFYTGKYDLFRPGVTLYLRNRFLRIFPLMFIVALLATISQLPGVFAAPQVAVRLLLFQFNGRGDGAPTNLGAFWSLSTEWQYYLLVPAAFAIALAASRLFVSRRKLLLPLATLLVLGVGVMNRNYIWTHHGGATTWAAYLFPTLIGSIDVFLLGFLTNWWVPRLARFARVIAAVWPLLLVGIYLAYSFTSFHAFFANGTGPWFRIHAVVMPGAVALALIPVLVGCEIWNQKARLRLVPQRRLAVFLFWVGELTYPIYLVHCAILEGVQAEIPHGNYAAKWVIATILIVLVAWVLHVIVEEPVLNWRRRRAMKVENTVLPETLRDVTV
jgi:peptidoglycan/LPS O-acetylase OafA/YrhL